MKKVSQIQAALVDAGFTLAKARENAIERVVEDDIPLHRINCTGDKPGDWERCPHGSEGDEGFCAHGYGDLCRHPDTKKILRP